MGVVVGKDQSLQADERTAAFTNGTIQYTKKRRTCEIKVHILLLWMRYHKLGKYVTNFLKTWLRTRY